MSAATIEEFLELVRKSGLLDEERLDAFFQDIRNRSVLPVEPALLTEAMVRAGLLTSFQAESLLEGGGPPQPAATSPVESTQANDPTASAAPRQPGPLDTDLDVGITVPNAPAPRTPSAPASGRWTCPFCRSRDVRPSHFRWHDVLLWPVGGRACRCRACRQRFFRFVWLGRWDG